MPKSAINQATINSFLNRGVENVYPSREALLERLESGKKIRVYLGIDPTGPTLHLGHVIPMRKLAALQKLGHEIILLMGDFTAMIGDPTDKSATRVRLTHEQVLQNCANYKKQAGVILNFSGKNPAKLMYNSKWLGKMSFGDVVELAAHFTVQQMAERDMFEARMKDGKPVYLHEFLYPLMQGYDSVAMEVDLEIGGNDQTFNMLAGRTLMKEIKGKDKFVLTTKLLADTSGKKMGKTEGNMIALSDSPEDMYGKVMSWSDGMIVPGFELCTNVSQAEIADLAGAMEDGENPVQYKHRLAREIVATLLGEGEANKAQKHFSTVFKAREVPKEIEEVCVGAKSLLLVDALVKAKLVSSKSEARRQIEQGGVKVDGKVVKTTDATVQAPAVLQKGKRHFVRIMA